MLILERLTARSSRSLAVMTGFARSATGRGHGDPLAGPQGCRSRAFHRSSPSRSSDSPQQVKE
jgi:hypothetical protein